MNHIHNSTHTDICCVLYTRNFPSVFWELCQIWLKICKYYHKLSSICKFSSGPLNTLVRLSYLPLKIQPFLNDWLFFICVYDVSNFSTRCNKCFMMRLEIVRHKTLACIVRPVVHPINRSVKVPQKRVWTWTVTLGVAYRIWFVAFPLQSFYCDLTWAISYKTCA